MPQGANAIEVSAAAPSGVNFVQASRRRGCLTSRRCGHLLSMLLLSMLLMQRCSLRLPCPRAAQWVFTARPIAPGLSVTATTLSGTKIRITGLKSGAGYVVSVEGVTASGERVAGQNTRQVFTLAGGSERISLQQFDPLSSTVAAVAAFVPILDGRGPRAAG